MQGDKYYRVVCSQIPFSDQVFVDIAPTDGNRFGVTHEMIFYSRMRLAGENLCDYGTASVFLVEHENQSIEVDFSLGFHAPKGSWEHDSYMRMCSRVEPQIIQTFKQMREEGKSSTLNYIMSVPEMEVFKEQLNIRKNQTRTQLSDEEQFALREKRKRAEFAEKHKDLFTAPSQLNDASDSAQSYAQETMIEQRKNALAVERRRQNKLDDMANLHSQSEDVIAVMRRKMKMYDGD